MNDHGSRHSSRPHEPPTPPRPAPTHRKIQKGGPPNVCATATYLRESLETSQGTTDAGDRRSDGGGGDGDGRGWGGGVRRSGRCDGSRVADSGFLYLLQFQFNSTADLL